MLLFKKKNLIISVLALICTALTLCFFCIYNNEKPAQAETAVEQNEPSAHADTCPYHGTPLTAGGYLASGDYYLTGDTTISSQITISGGVTVNLCLNGYMLISTGSSGAIGVLDGGTLNLFDCGGDGTQKHYYTKNPANSRYIFGTGTDYITGGVITQTVTANYGVYNRGGTINMFGGTVAGFGYNVADAAGFGGAINMYGGKICGAWMTGLAASSEVNLYGGEITDNNCGMDSTGVVTIQGDIKIYDNFQGGVNAKDLASAGIVIGDAGLSSGACIGITIKNGYGQQYENGSFIVKNNSNQSLDEIMTYFFSDAGVHAHNYGTLIPQQDPTCTQDGIKAHYICSICGAYFDENNNAVQDQDLIIPALGHNYSVTWQWASDYSSATATYTCANCGDTGTLTATPTSTKTDPTCTVDGSTVYTATVTLPDGSTETDTATDTIPATGHSYTVTSWQWASDYSTATATYVCSVCGDTGTLTTTPTSTKTDPDCTTDGSIVYTATVTLPDGTTETDTATDTIPATGHTYQVTGWVWASDYSTATATYVCSVCGDTGTVTGTPSYVQTDPTCTVDGLIGYTVTVTLPDGTTATDNNGQTLPATGHQWDSGTVVPPTCTNDGYTIYTCTVCGETKQDDPVPATGHQWDSGTVVPPTCTDDGYTIYTCTVCGDTKKQDPVPATGHTYQESGWDWASDYSNATLNFTCSVCGDNITYPADSITYVDDEEEGTRTYTATVTVDGVTYTDEQTAPIPEEPIKVYGCAGCVGGIDWILVLCIGLLLFDVVMFAITMRVICSKPKDDDDDEEKDGNDEYEFIEG